MPRSSQNNNAPGCLNFLSIFLNGNSKDDKNDDKMPYQLKKDFLSPSEKSFFEVLRFAAGSNYHIFAKTRLNDIIHVEKNTNSFQSWLNRISRKHIDFLLCDPVHYKPLLVIELDDKSHKNPKRSERDELVDDILKTVGLPILHVQAKNSYSIRELMEQISTLTGIKPSLPETV